MFAATHVNQQRKTFYCFLLVNITSSLLRTYVWLFMFNVGRGFALVINFYTLLIRFEWPFYTHLFMMFQDFLFPSLLMKTPMLGL